MRTHARTRDLLEDAEPQTLAQKGRRVFFAAVFWSTVAVLVLTVLINVFAVH